MRVLVTRPRPDAESLAARIHALGHTTLVEPLINIAFLEGPLLDLNGVQALVLTSVNGARAAARRIAERATPVLAVGPATAGVAKELGFTHVTESTGEGIGGLAEHIRATVKPTAGALLHATGSVTAGDLKQGLAPFGLIVRTERLYDAHAAEGLSGALTAELSAGLIDTALFFSPRTASLFAALAGTAGLASACSGILALALSDAVAAALKPLEFREVAIARKPTADAMLERLKAA